MKKNKPHFVRFSELTENDVNRDFQIHTCATDGEATIKQIIEQARSLGLKEIAFTEHVRSSSTYFAGFAAEVDAARKNVSDLVVYVGIEAKANDYEGALDASPEILEIAEIVLGSVHRFPTTDGRFLPAKEFSYEEAAKLEFQLATMLVKNAPIDVLSHPGGMCLRAFKKFPYDYFRELMRTTLKYGVAFEINASYHLDMDSLLALCREVDPIVSVGSDVHKISELGLCRDSLLMRRISCQ